MAFPAFIEDAAQAVAWVYQNAAAEGFDLARFYIGGISAGAYLATMLAMDPRYLSAHGIAGDELAGVVALSAQVSTHFMVREERGLPPHVVASDDASPMFFTRTETPRLTLIVADDDIPARLEENQFFAAALQAAGNTRVEYHMVPDREHHTLESRLGEPGDPTAGLILGFLGC